MAWFDRNPGGRKISDGEPIKAPEALKPMPEAAVVPAPQPNPAPKPEVAAPSPPVPAGLVGYLYKGSRVSGQLSFQGAARIDGIVEGEIHCQGLLTIGEGAEIRAKISAQAVVIRGKVDGNVSAEERVELLAPARLIGNVSAPRLIIAEGVVFDGDCSMGAAKQKGGIASSQNITISQNIISGRAAATPSAKLQADSKN